MKFCQAHWDELKAAVERKGMGDLIAPSGAAAVYRMKQELEGTATDSAFDPLLAAHWAIARNAIEMGGLYIMGDYCPLCEVKEHLGETEAKAWIEYSTDAMREYCLEQGLIGNGGE